MTQPVLEMRGITKRFPGVLANDHVDLTLYPGEIHALLGENGAGKSTLMNVLTGIYAPNEGSIRYKGKTVRLKSPKSAVDLGIGMVHQHFKLIEPLTVAENVFLYSGRCKCMLNAKKMNQSIKECSEYFNLQVDPAARIWQLSVGEQQRVEIIKLLFCGAELLILDEPTAVLTPQETVELFKTLRKMAEDGKSVLFITHKLYEVMTFSDRITVLRNGRSMDTMPTKDTTRQELTHLMVGRDVLKVLPERIPVKSAEEVLRLEGVGAMGDKGVPALNRLNLTIYGGEILGIAGVAGNGQRELSEVIAGMRRITGGRMLLKGEDVTNLSPRDSIKKGIAFVPEDRMGMGLVAGLDMVDNAILRDYAIPPINKKGILNKKEAVRRTEAFVKAHEIKNAGIKKPVRLMSGGNLQKLLIAREINGDPDVLVAAYPVHGLDIGATETIHNILMEQRARGAAILLISEDLEELFELSDRVAALYEGEVMGVVPVENVSQELYDRVGSLMLGVREETPAQEQMEGVVGV
ncbi:MAG: ABC transporter ATP-binding protein [Bacillota bacterium]